MVRHTADAEDRLPKTWVTVRSGPVASSMSDIDPTHAQSSPSRPARPEYDVVLTVRNPQRPGMIGRMLSLVGDHGAGKSSVFE